MTVSGATTNNGAINLDTTTLNANVSGTGNLTATAGASTLNGINSYSGATHIATGATLTTDVASGLSPNSDFTNDGSLLFSGDQTVASLTNAGTVTWKTDNNTTLTVNGNHPVYKNILATGVQEKQEKLVHNLADLALLSQGLLKGNSLTNFINRSVEMMS